MTIEEMTPQILEAFNTVVSSPAAQELFKQRLSLWKTQTALYSTQEEYVAVLCGWADTITTEIALTQYMATQEPLTKKYTITSEKGTKIKTEHDGADTTTTTNGNDNTKSYVYPTGYTGTSDTQYLAAETDKPETTDTTTTERGTNDTVTYSGADTVTNTEMDLSTFFAVSKDHGRALIRLIDLTVFDCFKYYSQKCADIW